MDDAGVDGTRGNRNQRECTDGRSSQRRRAQVIYAPSGSMPEPSDIEVTLLQQTTTTERSERSVADAYRDFSPNTLAHQLSNFIQNLERH
jgi:hypothetical protein